MPIILAGEVLFCRLAWQDGLVLDSRIYFYPSSKNEWGL
jgi:hypothetical protein